MDDFEQQINKMNERLNADKKYWTDYAAAMDAKKEE